MIDIFLQLVNMSISASWIVLALVLLRFLFKRGYKWLMVALWALVAIRLIIPFSFESMLSIIPTPATFVYDPLFEQGIEIKSGFNSIDQSLNNVVGNSFDSIVKIMAMIWLIGMIVMLLYVVISYYRIQQKVKASIRLEDNLYACDYIDSPFILGIIKPCIYLPSNLDLKDREYVIAHEQAHLKRYDHYWKPLGFLILSIYWFNPLMWLAYYLFTNDIELACDELVIRNLGEDHKKAYSYALLNCSSANHLIRACPLAFSEGEVKNRIKSILNYHQPSFWVMMTSIMVILVLVISFMSNPYTTELNLDIVVADGESYHYSDVYLMSNSDEVEISVAGDFDYTNVALKPIDTHHYFEGRSYPIKNNKPQKIKVEPNQCYKIGIIKNSWDIDNHHVKLRIKNVHRIHNNHHDILSYKTNYIGDAPKVRAIVERLPYPQNYAKVVNMQINSDCKPYELIVNVDGRGETSQNDFYQCATIAFDLIENMDRITFIKDHQHVLASFDR